jgi:hypothetical protein
MHVWHSLRDWNNDYYCIKRSTENTGNVQVKIGNENCEMESHSLFNKIRDKGKIVSAGYWGGGGRGKGRSGW